MRPGSAGLLEPAPEDVERIVVAQPDGDQTTVAEIMAATNTDGWILTRHGKVLAEHYPRGMAPDTRHILMSVSKSLVGVVAGALTASGELDPAELRDRLRP